MTSRIDRTSGSRTQRRSSEAASFDQAPGRDRYAVIPRTLVFLRRADSYLLLKGADGKAIGARLYNGVGGHVERGEDVWSAARRELLEETGLTADIWLCGTVMVDAGETGVALYVFSGEPSGGEMRDSREGRAEWIAYQSLDSLAAVDDLQQLITRVHAMRRGDEPFSAHSALDSDGILRVQFVG